MSILITGNRGFIGSGLKGDGIDLKDGVDILTYRATKRYDVVIHTAALVSVTESMKDLAGYWRTNVDGTVNMLRQHPEAHFIYLSTAAAYGPGEDHKVGDHLYPTSPYAKSKIVGELAVKYFAKTYCILRLTNVVGDGERGEPNVFQVFKKADILPIYGDGLQTRDFISVDDVRAVIMEMAHLKTQGTYNVGSGKSKTILEVARTFDKPVRFFPEREGEIRRFGVADAIHPHS